jgi:hypothetical protein
VSYVADFNPNFKSPHVAPEFGNDGATDFDFEAIYRRLDGEAAPGEEVPDLTALDPVKAIRVLMTWTCGMRAQDARALQAIATRCIALAWVSNPAMFGNRPGRDVAEHYKVPYTKFSQHAAEFSRVFRIQNRLQIHDGKNTAQPKAFLREN